MQPQSYEAWIEYVCLGLNTSGAKNGTVDLSTLLAGGAELVDLEDEEEDQEGYTKKRFITVYLSR